MNSTKTNTLLAAALLLFSPLAANHCRAGTPSLDPELVSAYRQMVALEDGIPKPQPENKKEDDRIEGRNLEVQGYLYQKEKLRSALEHKIRRLLPDLNSKYPEVIRKRRAIVFALQKEYEATESSLFLMVWDPRQTSYYSSMHGGPESTKYVHTHPSLRFTKLVEFGVLGKYWFLPPAKHPKNKAPSHDLH